MRYFEEYCEVHLEPNIAPFTWVFRTDDKICIRFSISLSKDPDCGQIAYEMNDGQGYSDSGRITAHTEGIVENCYLMFSAILPPISSGGGYRYSLGYVDMSGSEHTSVRSRFLLVCDTSPRSMAEIQSVFLGFVDNQPVYRPIPRVEMTSSPQNWDARIFYSIIIRHLQNLIMRCPKPL